MFLNEVVPALKAGGLVPQGDGSDGEISVGQWKWTGVVRVPEVVNQGEEEGGEGEGELELESLRSRLLALRTPHNPQNVFRKLDLSMAPMPSKATALLFLTGDVEFVRDMRMRADRMGLVLNEFGLWRWDEEGDAEGEEGGLPTFGSWTLIPTPTEHALFAALGIEYIPPEKRNYSFLLSRWSKATGRLRRGGEEGAGVGVVLRS
ncbi:dna polymerase beta [Lentinula edodes]|uniref:Dna polymerase beta n=1 Tax=Lentinula edodes TaxID=5353 RepID=A0A1Q3E1T7_LENED|nr:dna polymerase beta [Lentinula edodes]